MTYQILIGKVTQYLHLCASLLAKWLEKKLPDVLGDDWWKIGVINKLSYNQQEIVTANKITSLTELDLSALLRVADRNWYSIQSRYFLKQSDRMTIQNMFGVRNKWAHASTAPPTRNSVISDLKTLGDFMRFVETGRTNLISFKQFLNDFDSFELSDTGHHLNKQEAQKQAIIPDSKISVNSIVHLLSDHNTKGMVASVEKVGETLKYKVFVNSQIREFFDGQIELEQVSDNHATVDITDIRRLLTAYQIKKPSADSLYSLNAARIDFVPYQFRPALKLIKSDTPRLLIADSVGVGKTIEAGLVIKEIQARTSLETILIICPKPLVAERKWEIEMKRFDEDFIAVDGKTLRYVIQEAERDGEWPDRYRRLIIPYSLLTEELLQGKIAKNKRKLPGLYDLDPTPLFDMVIVDEAHHVRNSNTQAYKAVKYFCDNANSAIFLTATPLQLGNEDLFTLLNLLYPETVIDKASFSAMVEPNEYINRTLHYLRVPNHESDALTALRDVVSTDWGRNVIAPNPLYKHAVATLMGDSINREQRIALINDVESMHSFASMINRTRRQDIEDFCVRRAYTLSTDFTERQRELHDELLNFVATVMNTLYPTISLKFLMCTIRRQAASCIFGLAPYIRDIVERGINAVTDDYDDISELGNDGIDLSHIKQLAERVIELAENMPNEDSKFDKFAEIILERQARAINKMIVFTSFRHTQKYLYRKINAMGDIRVAYVDGGVKDEERFALRERFALPKEDSKAIDILLFTEVGSEGLDYQFCNTIVNYDIPWNPMRVEQRIGRIDRRGQESDVAHIYNCITHRTIDEEIFNRCMVRIGVFEQSIGDCSDILGKFANGIKELIFDSTLTEQERSLKMEQLADNEVRKVQEMRRIEENENQMFGLDISGFIEDINKADNPWLSSEALNRLITGYLEKRLGNDMSRLSEGRLRLSQADKTLLTEDYRELGDVNKDVVWERFLRSGAKVCHIAFGQEAAKDPKTLFLTAMHPLVRQAANAFFSDNDHTVSIEMSSSDIAPGKYPFQFYIWDYKGGKSRTVLMPISINSNVQMELSAVIQNAVSSDITTNGLQSEWNKLAETHLTLWRLDRKRFKDEADSQSRYKIESLSKSVMARKNIAQRQINETNNDKIIQMRTSEIERIEGEFAAKKALLEETARLADIHTTLLVNGLLTVKED